MQEMTKHLMLITLQYSWVQRAGDDGLVWARNGDPGRWDLEGTISLSFLEFQALININLFQVMSQSNHWRNKWRILQHLKKTILSVL